MPWIFPSSYHPPWGWSNGHLQSLFPAIFRHVPLPHYRRERIGTSDGDFLDLDWLESGGSRLAILSHGLEGSSSSTYIRAMAQKLHQRGWDVLAWNCRGCSGEPNRLLRFYHSGSSDDLDTVARHALGQNRHDSIALIGFSLGGNITLKWLGDKGGAIDARVFGAVTFSVPCDLAASSIKLALPINRLYMWRFLSSLRRKVLWKTKLFPEGISAAGIGQMRTFKEFDDAFTAPLHGFQSAEDYWQRCGSKQFLSAIRVPTLLVNARDDPFLAESCFPIEEAKASDHFYFESPAAGGHVGFMLFNTRRMYWSELRALEFLGGVRDSLPLS